MTDLADGKRFWLGGGFILRRWFWYNNALWDYENFRPGLLEEQRSQQSEDLSGQQKNNLQPGALTGGKPGTSAEISDTIAQINNINNIIQKNSFCLENVGLAYGENEKGKWDKRTCGNITQGYVCKKCPKGWLAFQGSCYLYVETLKNWENSRSYCLRQKVSQINNHF